jgi:uncharacterized protein involved in outer membrane biogenesis
VKVFSSNRRRIAAGVFFLLLLFLIRPGASRLKSRIIHSISSGVGRSVDIGAVHVRLLPRPGFDLENLVVYDDPAFGAEPILRASEVTAALRLTSLWRGRLEIARLELTEPSLNLVHGENGRWNLEALLERSAHTPLAPTAKAKSEPRQGFPYIQATSARINFKRGTEKTPYALTNADFSLWQESENIWGVRMKAQPVRTDLNVNDTGILQVNGTWQRADTLHDTPVDFSMEWNRAQLGQLTKLFTGNDQGWRGGVQIDVTLVGTPAKLQITSDASIRDFRRYDITSGEALTLAGHCDGYYGSSEHTFHEVDCNAPVGPGNISLKGNIGLPGSNKYELVLTAENVPASAAAALAQRTKKNLPDDLVASGTVHSKVSIEEDGTPGSQLQLEGKGEIDDFHLSSASNKTELAPGTIPFFLSSMSLHERGSSKRAARKSMPVPDGEHLEFGPFPLAAGRSAAPAVRGWANRSGYNVFVNGESEIAKTLRVARMFGLPALKTAADGMADLDLQVAGSWAGEASGFSGPQVTGIAKLRNVRAAFRGIDEPVEISSAEMQFLPDGVQITKLTAKAADAVWTGSLEMPRGCGTPDACELHFDLSANSISPNKLGEWASASAKEKDRPWYRILESRGQMGPSLLESVRASGRLTADRLQVGSVVATHASANLILDKGKLQISGLGADFLDGRYLADWYADFGTNSGTSTAECGGSGSLTGISLSRLAGMTNIRAISGTASASYEIKSECTAEFWNLAEGTLQFEIRDGSLSRISLGEDEGPLKISRLSVQAGLHNGSFEIKQGDLVSPGDKFQLSGTAGLNRELALKLKKTTNGSGSWYAIRGTLAAPRVVQLVGTEQAQLKAEPAK